MSKRERFFETLKDFLVFILLVCLVCCCAIYMLSYQGQESPEFTKEKMDAISGDTARHQYIGYFDKSYALPTFIGISYHERGRFGFCTEEGLATANESLVLFYEKLFGEEGAVEMLSSEEGKALFNEALFSDNYIYASYACDLPKTVICAMMGIDTDGISGEYIREIFIVPDAYIGTGDIRGPLHLYSSGSSIYTFIAIARDSLGNYYRYTTDYVPKEATDISFNQNFCFAYSTLEGAATYDFAALLKMDTYLENMRFPEKVTDTTVVFRDNSNLPLSILDVSVEAVDEGLADAYLQALLINPEKASEYTDENGTRFYFDGGRNVVITADDILTYSAPEGGISMEDIFGARIDGGNASVYEYIGAALALAEDMETVKRMGDESPYQLSITSIDYDGEIFSVSLGYRAGGLPIYIDGTADILKVDFSRGSICGVTYHLRAVRGASGAASVPQMLWTLRSAITDTDARYAYYYAYVVTENDIDVRVVGDRAQ